jgi:hypothetical protein
MQSLPRQAQDILRRYREIKERRSFEFKPPDEQASFGEFAFDLSVVDNILVGVATGLLTDAFMFAVAAIRSAVRGPSSPEAILGQVRTQSATLRDGLDKLVAQGINTDDAHVALQFLEEALLESLKARAEEAGAAAPASRPAEKKADNQV